MPYAVDQKKLRVWLTLCASPELVSHTRYTTSSTIRSSCSTHSPWVSTYDPLPAALSCTLGSAASPDDVRLYTAYSGARRVPSSTSSASAVPPAFRNEARSSAPGSACDGIPPPAARYAPCDAPCGRHQTSLRTPPPTNCATATA